MRCARSSLTLRELVDFLQTVLDSLQRSTLVLDQVQPPVELLLEEIDTLRRRLDQGDRVGFRQQYVHIAGRHRLFHSLLHVAQPCLERTARSVQQTQSDTQPLKRH
jgi:hypothetical protein